MKRPMIATIARAEEQAADELRLSPPNSKPDLLPTQTVPIPTERTRQAGEECAPDERRRNLATSTARTGVARNVSVIVPCRYSVVAISTPKSVAKSRDVPAIPTRSRPKRWGNAGSSATSYTVTIVPSRTMAVWASTIPRIVRYAVTSFRSSAPTSLMSPAPGTPPRASRPRRRARAGRSRSQQPPRPPGRWSCPRQRQSRLRRSRL